MPNLTYMLVNFIYLAGMAVWVGAAGSILTELRPGLSRLVQGVGAIRCVGLMESEYRIARPDLIPVFESLLGDALPVDVECVRRPQLGHDVSITIPPDLKVFA